MSQLETIADTNGLSNKRRCDKCKKIKVLPAFRYAEGESYNLCIACEYGKESYRCPTGHTTVKKRYLINIDDFVKGQYSYHHRQEIYEGNWKTSS